MKLSWVTIGILSIAGMAMAQRTGPGAGHGPGGGMMRPPTSRPSGASANRPDGPGAWQGGRGMEFNREEWDEAKRFFSENSPRRFEAMKNSFERGGPGVGMILTRYRSIKWLQNDKDLYANKVAQMRDEDAIFGAWMDLRREGAISESQREEYRQTMQQRVANLVKLRTEERRLRIERIAQALQRERESLQKDEARQNEMIKEIYERAQRGDFEWLPRPHRDGPTTQPRRGAMERPERPDRDRPDRGERPEGPGHDRPESAGPPQ